MKEKTISRSKHLSNARPDRRANSSTVEGERLERDVQEKKIIISRVASYPNILSLAEIGVRCIFTSSDPCTPG
jgi:hypothetical protein